MFVLALLLLSANAQNPGVTPPQQVVVPPAGATAGAGQLPAQAGAGGATAVVDEPRVCTLVGGIVSVGQDVCAAGGDPESCQVVFNWGKKQGLLTPGAGGKMLPASTEVQAKANSQLCSDAVEACTDACAADNPMTAQAEKAGDGAYGKWSRLNLACERFFGCPEANKPGLPPNSQNLQQQQQLPSVQVAAQTQPIVPTALQSVAASAPAQDSELGLLAKVFVVGFFSSVMGYAASIHCHQKQILASYASLPQV